MMIRLDSWDFMGFIWFYGMRMGLVPENDEKCMEKTIPSTGGKRPFLGV